MPIYDYRCENDHETEDIRPYSKREDVGPPCHVCDKETRYVPSSPKGQKYRHKNAWKNRNTNFTEI